jgi:hypothetical protein
VETQPGVVRSGPKRGLGTSFYGQPPVMKAIPLQSGAEVIVTEPPPSSAGKEDEIAELSPRTEECRPCAPS